MSWETTMNERSRLALKAVWQEIQAGRPDAAAARLRELSPDSKAVRNAQAVCLMLRGECQKAIELLGALVFPRDGLMMDSGADPAWCANFCLALLRSGNQDGFRSYAGKLEPSGHPAVDAVRGLLHASDQPGKGFGSRLRRLFAGTPPVKLPPDFPAGWPEQWLTDAPSASAPVPSASGTPSPARTSSGARADAVPPTAMDSAASERNLHRRLGRRRRPRPRHPRLHLLDLPRHDAGAGPAGETGVPRAAAQMRQALCHLHRSGPALGHHRGAVWA